MEHNPFTAEQLNQQDFRPGFSEFRFEFSGGEVVSFNLFQVINPEAETLPETLLEFPRISATVSAAYEQARHFANSKRLELKNKKAKKWLEVKEMETDARGKALSDTRATMVVDADSEIQELEALAKDAEDYARILRAQLDAINSYFEALRSAGANLRAIATSNHQQI